MIAAEPLNRDVALEWGQTHLDDTENNKQSEHNCGRFQMDNCRENKLTGVSLANPIFEGHLLEYTESEYVISEGREFVQVIVRVSRKVVRFRLNNSTCRSGCADNPTMRM